MTQPQQIQLSVEEGIEFARFQARQEGFLEGVQSAQNHALRSKVNEIIAARQKNVRLDTVQESKPDEPKPANAAANEPIPTGAGG